MPSNYIKTAWNNQDPRTPLNGGNLNNIENGIFNASTDATAAMDLSLQNAADIISNATDATSYTNSKALMWSKITTSPTTASANTGIFSSVNSGIHTINLPSGNDQDRVRIVDIGTISYGFSISIVPFGDEGIMDLNEALELITEFSAVELVFVGADSSWYIVSKT